MRKNRILALILALSMIFCLAACGKKDDKAGSVTVTFDTDGGNAIEPQVVKKGSAIVKPDTPKKDGYIFDSWMLGSEKYDFGSAVNEDMTLKAKWIDPNGDNGSSGSSGSSGGSGGSSGSSSSSTSDDVKVEELYWVNNWYWVQELCDGDPEFVVKPASLRDKIVFSSSDTSIATVNENGIVHGIKPGNVTITMKCGDKTAQLPLEVRSAPKPGISLDTDHVVLHYHNNEVSDEFYPFTVSFHDGADPSSPVTWTSSNPYVADVTSLGVVGGRELGFTTITATTAEGYTASCEVYVVGTALRVYYQGQRLQYGQSFSISGSYELTLCEEYFFESGLSKSVYVAGQCVMSAYTGIGFSPQNEYYGLLYFDPAYVSGGMDYMIQFSDPLNYISSDLYQIYVY